MKNKNFLDEIKKLRVKTKAGIMDCRQALEASSGDFKKAEEWLREKGIKSADKRAQKATGAGLIETYTHGEGKIVGIIELGCETDFVARTAEFKELAHELAMQVAAMKPKNTKEFLAQVWIRDQGRKIEELVKELSGKTGENIKVNRVARFELGEEI
ncbi:MAG: translation elongation factor Ts [Candidatus Shapirobacteria bacterium]|nr:translation elongation factor Ts [Candidatus Shapirobacteria bacterium]